MKTIIFAAICLSLVGCQKKEGVQELSEEVNMRTFYKKNKTDGESTKITCLALDSSLIVYDNPVEYFISWESDIIKIAVTSKYFVTYPIKNCVVESNF